MYTRRDLRPLRGLLPAPSGHPSLEGRPTLQEMGGSLSTFRSITSALIAGATPSSVQQQAVDKPRSVLLTWSVGINPSPGALQRGLAPGANSNQETAHMSRQTPSRQKRDGPMNRQTPRRLHDGVPLEITPQTSPPPWRLRRWELQVVGSKLLIEVGSSPRLIGANTPVRSEPPLTVA